jgi:hypothetical protein
MSEKKKWEKIHADEKMNMARFLQRITYKKCIQYETFNNYHHQRI